MSRVRIDSNTTIELNSNQTLEASYDLEIVGNVTLIVKLSGEKQFNLKMDVLVTAASSCALLYVNNMAASLTLDDHYDLLEGSETVVAYSQLNKQAINATSKYQLLQPHASLRVLNVSITSTVNSFMQDCQHLAKETKANIDNYGIVLSGGKCQMVVKNTINKGFDDCQTHQTSRLLTFDEKAVGKILPILIIDDNEVAASHACSLGQPDENQIYYLMSRGLTYKESLRLIAIGYLMPITQIVNDENLNALLKEEIETKVSLYV